MAQINERMAKTKKERLIRISKRGNPSSILKLVTRLGAIGFSILFILIFLSSVSKSSFNQIWGYIGHGAFDTPTAFFKEMFLLLGIAIGLSPAYKMKFWNIGGQGQVLIGGLLTTTMMIYMGNAGLKTPFIILVSLVMAILAGGLFAAIPAIAKVQLNANETLFTLMMNYIAIQLVAFTTHMWNPWAAFGLVNTETHAGYLPAVGKNEYGVIIIVGVLLMILMYAYMHYTKHGYELSVVGESINTAKYVGIKTKRVIIRTVFLSGAICGLMGFLYVAGVDHTISTGTSGGYGFTAIIVAWAAQFNPFLMAVISFLIVLFSTGAAGVSNAVPGLNQYVSSISVGVFLLFIIGCEFFVNYKINFNSHITAKIEKFKFAIARKMPKTVAFIEKTQDLIEGIDDKINDKKEKIQQKVSGVASVISKKLKKEEGNTKPNTNENVMAQKSEEKKVIEPTVTPDAGMKNNAEGDNQ